VPSHERSRRFERDVAALTPAQRRRFRTAFLRFDQGLGSGTFRPGLRVKRVEGTDGIFEMTWAPDGRATFQYGESQGERAHVLWRRIGTHDVFRRP
jgi:hypothetical protein